MVPDYGFAGASGTFVACQATACHLPLRFKKVPGIAIVSRCRFAILNVVRDQTEVDHDHFAVGMDCEIVGLKSYLRIVRRTHVNVLQDIGLGDS